MRESVNLLDSEGDQINNFQEEVPFEVVLDSGAAEHVTDNIDAPGYSIVPSAGSKAGKAFDSSFARGEPTAFAPNQVIKVSS